MRIVPQLIMMAILFWQTEVQAQVVAQVSYMPLVNFAVIIFGIMAAFVLLKFTTAALRQEIHEMRTDIRELGAKVDAGFEKVGEAVTSIDKRLIVVETVHRMESREES